MQFDWFLSVLEQKRLDLLHRSCWVTLEVSTLRTSPRMEVPLVVAYLVCNHFKGLCYNKCAFTKMWKVTLLQNKCSLNEFRNSKILWVGLWKFINPMQTTGIDWMNEYLLALSKLNGKKGEEKYLVTMRIGMQSSFHLLKVR